MNSRRYIIFLLFLIASWSSSICAEVATPKEHRLHIWIKAFIPNEHPTLPGYIFKATNGTTVIPAPKLPNIIDFEKLKLNNTCFSTDNRGFDKSPMASARVTVELLLIIKGREIYIEPYEERKQVRIGETHNVDCVSGTLIGNPMKETEDSVSIGEIKKYGFRRVSFIKAKSSNPYYRIFDINIIPSIDFSFSIAYDAMIRTLTIDGMVGYFPAFEGYYSLDEGSVQSLFTLPPYKDSTAMSLIDLNTGINTRNIQDKIIVK